MPHTFLNTLKFSFASMCLLVGLSNPVAAQNENTNLGKYIAGETTVARLEGSAPNGNFMSFDFILRVADDDDCDTLSSGPAWEYLCEYAEKSDTVGRVYLAGNLVLQGASSNVYEGRMLVPDGSAWIIARILAGGDGYYVQFRMPEGRLGPVIAFTGSRAVAEPAIGRNGAVTAEHTTQGAGFKLILGGATPRGRTVELSVNATDADACLDLVPQTWGWQYLCEKSDKNGTEQIFSGSVRDQDGAAIGVIETPGGADVEIWIRDPRQGYAMVAVRTQAEWPFAGGTPASAIIFNGAVASKTTLPPLAPPAPPLLNTQADFSLEGNWQIDFGPVINIALSPSDNDGLSGIMLVPAYSDRDCVDRGGAGSVQRICEAADKDGQRTYNIVGAFSAGSAPVWSFETDGPADFEIMMGLSITNQQGVVSDAPYLRFNRNQADPTTGTLVWHKMSRANGTRQESANIDFFAPELGRVPTCEDMDAKLAELLSRRGEFQLDGGPSIFANLEWVIDRTHQEIDIGQLESVEACAKTWRWMETQIQAQIALAKNRGGGGDIPNDQLLRLMEISGKTILIVPPKVCINDAKSRFCNAVRAGPSEGFEVNAFASDSTTNWGNIDINGYAFVMRATYEGGTRQFSFYTGDAAERF